MLPCFNVRIGQAVSCIRETNRNVGARVTKKFCRVALSRMQEQSDPDHLRRSKRVQTKGRAFYPERAAPWREIELPRA